MPYRFTQDGGSAIEIAGYFYVQPFSTPGGKLQRNPNSARLLITLALTGYNDDTYPSPSAGLKPAGDIEIADPAAGTVLTARGFQTTTIVQSQSRDLALTHWIFNGSNNSTVDFTPALVNQAARAGRVHDEHRVRWYGYAESDGQEAKRLNLTYLSGPISFGQNRHFTTIDLLGIANVEGSGSLVSWLLSEDLDQYVGKIIVKDEMRKVLTDFAGKDGNGTAAAMQMNRAFGAAYSLNGIYTAQPAATIAAFARRFTDGTANVIRDAARDGTGIFAGLTQPLRDTPDGTGKNPNAYDVKGPDFEGLSIWDLAPRQGADAGLLF
ncbi:hypothetical protein Q5Y75_24625 [Ruegeria sp. 2205SS24-7]|uniref:hypothetical protein n=1 Tax=Ruegeria discodermiae TaxID=3064389 RepID=UPI0027424B43|nr:hypothetical protein [Ruegeria sp. 2205SS24-7]MDP5220377.1 hypothetical protein [Ruegeria sp. 2205SS24-7]